MHSITRHRAGVRPAQAAPFRILHVTRVWTRPQPDRDENFIKPTYIPTINPTPVITPSRREDAPLYAPAAPEFRPAELPEKPGELPEAPKMPERRPDPIPAGNPKERPPGESERRETPPAETK